MRECRNIRYELDYEPGRREFRRAEFWFDDPAEGEVHVKLQKVLTFRMRGIGYWHPYWAHGSIHGQLETGRESINLDDFDPLEFSSSHIQNLVIARMGGRTGVGVLEEIHHGPHSPTGLTGSSIDSHVTSPERPRCEAGHHPHVAVWSACRCDHDGVGRSNVGGVNHVVGCNQCGGTSEHVHPTRSLSPHGRAPSQAGFRRWPIPLTTSPYVARMYKRTTKSGRCSRSGACKCVWPGSVVAHRRVPGVARGLL